MLEPITTGMQNVGTGVTNLINKIPGVNLPGGTGVTDVFLPGRGPEEGGNPLDPEAFAKKYLTDYVGSQLGLTSQDPEQQKRLQQQRELQRINWEVPLAVGAGAHEYQKRYLADQPCLLYTSPSPRDGLLSRMPSSA